MATNYTRPEQGTESNQSTDADREPAAIPSDENGLVAGSFDTLSAALIDIVNEAPAVQRLRERVEFLDDRIAAVERVEGRLRELEADVAVVADLRQAMRSVVLNLETLDERADELGEHQSEVEGRLEDLENEFVAEQDRFDELVSRLEAIEGVFSARVMSKEEAHTQATKRDPSQVVQIGDVRTLYVEEVLADGPEVTAMGRLERLVVFVHFEDRDISITEGDTIEVRVTDLQDTCAHAVHLREVMVE